MRNGIITVDFHAKTICEGKKGGKRRTANKTFNKSQDKKVKVMKKLLWG
jgi:hypothetical protein